ncbi:pyridoxamine 5'-phosphate oxidase [Mycobacterium nebraskense]|uniref:Pyridoxamine 5'-phosphate oxidase n=1 Tax=Mycobacterium nebraskense TaxID=244292 RepID=A0A1X2A0W9_9MYCO|nr:pyridoxamine 5'-phosphate oxidase [Mycobacterium nebraskense]MCV7116734.1 pyridoxamine 5'-phosphate oxidase family protein [Mycobacterium nebraskense]ORW34606.1 pyridoxamine 5'-phosphate oxidase [Mycobacterium nebraskense]
MSARSVRFELVLRHLGKQHFAVLSTSDENGIPYAAGVNYGISTPAEDLVIYVMTRRHLRKARNIAQNPNVSLVVPLTRRLLWFLPPPTIQLRGRAEILDWRDTEGIDVFERFWLGRRILKGYRNYHRRGETRICFLKITLDPVIRTYMVGANVWQVSRRMESGAAKLIIPHQTS